MSYVSLKNVTKKFGNNQVLSGIDMNVEKGEFVTLLGPSGCGKSTILRILAGLTDETTGSIFIDGKDMSNVAPKDRQVGMVFQSYALFPNLTVKDNVGFGLAMQKVSKQEIEKRVDEILKIVHLSDKKDAYPAQLSGGQQQRVALARSIVVRPKVLLLDEPLSALDAQIRKSLQTDLRNIQKEIEMTMILVTHDQEEAMVVSDNIFLMNKGLIAQEGNAVDLYTRPKTEFVASFIGHYNLFTKNDLEQLLNVQVDNNEKFAIRPEAIGFEAHGDSYHFQATAKDSIMNGNVIRTVFEVKGITFGCETLHHEMGLLESGKTYDCYINKKDVVGLT